ncbi:MAG: GNAT family N-acetyltransferase [Anaeromusa sp.]|uniref:GNAT family N-acetyltransferase n=1 Tax=Anaeromusa sp. TaxID=1872520 RepID=UPI00261FBD91|nr:GNAT family N-acetyltransferase [Anaeromusa sp.]MDD3156940.1 GNAT family N-acetyltransferase [Anaeromusa sp.]MEA4834767.1 GNAT family N-acetyltransferase [Anaeromusa sp.]
MNMQSPSYCIELLQAADTWALRQEAMWPDKDISFVQLPGDEKAVHFGLFVITASNCKVLVSCLSVFSNDAALQLRKFATLPSRQQQGWGSKLLRHVLKESSHLAQGRAIVLDSRQEKEAFYASFGFQREGEPFEKNGRFYVRMKWH